MQNIITTPPPSDFEVDSFRIKIPYQDCKILSHELDQLYLTINSNTSEIVNERLNNRIDVGDDYVKLWVQVRSYNALVQTKHKGTYANLPQKYIVVTVHSKLLKSLYLDRITLQNVHLIYDAIMDYKVFYCTRKTFLNSDVLDIDFCRNLQIPNWLECKSYILEHLKRTKDLNRGCYEFKSKDNVGLQFGTRDKSTYSNPYIKIYHKYLELTTKSKLFTERYLNDAIDIPKDLFRVEYTLKDKKHYQRYDLGSRLIDMLQIPNHKKEFICAHMFSFQFDMDIYQVRTPRKKTTLKKELLDMEIKTMPDMLVYLLLQSIKNYGDMHYNLELLFDEIDSAQFPRSTRKRLQNRFSTILAKLPTKEQDAIINNELEFKQAMMQVQRSIEQIGINEQHFLASQHLRNYKTDIYGKKRERVS